MLLRNSSIIRLHLRTHLRTMKQLNSRAQPMYVKLLHFFLLLVLLRLIVRIKDNRVFVWVEGLWGGRGEREGEGGGDLINAERERVVQGSAEDGWGRAAVYVRTVGRLATGGCWGWGGAEFIT